MKKLLVLIAAILAVSAPIAITAAPAQAKAGSPGCVTRAEYRQVDVKGRDAWTRKHVTREFGARGDASGQIGTGTAVLYKTCRGGWSYFAEVDFNHGRATWKYYPRSISTTY